MNHEEEILALANIDPVEYLNAAHPRAERAAVLANRNLLESFCTEINEQLRLSFVANSESLLEILETYQFCHDAFSGQHLPRLTHSAPLLPTSPARQAALQKKAARFSPEIQPFLTPTRFLLSDALFDNQSVYALLTNDILILGERIEESESKNKISDLSALTGLSSPETAVAKVFKSEFNIKRVIETRGLRLSNPSKGLLRIHAAPGDSLALTADDSVIQAFIEAFETTSAETPPHKQTPEDSEKAERIAFLLETRQFEDLRKDFSEERIRSRHGDSQRNSQRNSCTAETAEIAETAETAEKRVTLLGLEPASSEEVSVILEFFEDPFGELEDFVAGRFQQVLEGVNEIQSLVGFVDEVFDRLEEVAEEAVGLYERVGRGGEALEEFGKARAAGKAAVHESSSEDSEKSLKSEKSEKSEDAPVKKRERALFWQARKALCLERLVEMVFRRLEPRLFGRTFEVARHEEGFKRVGERLRFGGFDLGYLGGRLARKREEYLERCVGDAEEEIRRKLEGMEME